jgi:putative ABC transport system substrate-binding protein
MKRRNFITLLGGAAAWPVAGRAQQRSKPFRIGFLSPAARNSTRLFDAFRQKMRELGYIEGQNIVTDYRLAAGDASRLPGMAADLVRLPVDVIVTDGGQQVARIAHQATRTIPIVMATAPSDPVAAGLAEKLSHPGGNLTGFTLFGAELSGKRLEFLKDAYPRVGRVAAIWDPGSGPVALRATEEAALALAVQLTRMEVAIPGEIGTGIEMAIQRGAEAIDILPSAMLWNERVQIVAAVATHRLPAIYPEREYAEDGGLFAYGPDVAVNFRKAAGYVDMILKGAKPGDLPIEQPTKFELVINLKTAKALGLTVPQSILARADEVIE